MKTIRFAAFLLFALPGLALGQVHDGTCPLQGPTGNPDDRGTASLRDISAALNSAPVIAAADNLAMGCEERHAGRGKLAEGKKIDAVPQRQQLNDCTLAALKSAMGWLASQYHTANPTLYGTPMEMDALLATALKAGIFDFDASGKITGMQLAKLAKFAHDYYLLDAGYRAKEIFSRTPSVQDLRDAANAGIPVIVAVCVDAQGCPVTPDAAHPHPTGHAAVIEGFVKDDEGREYVVVKHGWRDKDFLWRVDDFQKSWSEKGNEMISLKPTAASADLARREELINNRK